MLFEIGVLDFIGLFKIGTIVILGVLEILVGLFRIGTKFLSGVLGLLGVGCLGFLGVAGLRGDPGFLVAIGVLGEKADLGPLITFTCFNGMGFRFLLAIVIGWSAGGGGGARCGICLNRSICIFGEVVMFLGEIGSEKDGDFTPVGEVMLVRFFAWACSE